MHVSHTGTEVRFEQILTASAAGCDVAAVHMSSNKISVLPVTTSNCRIPLLAMGTVLWLWDAHVYMHVLQSQPDNPIIMIFVTLF